VNDPSTTTNDASLRDQPATELDDTTEEISLEDADKISGGVTSTQGS
jgi:hypothetical protein